ncbi:putative nuclease HARBI1 [Cucumis melo var. makuwa]|uniref:Nuclease HARBI1 n=1 Tax=Cucumis melo var. makuwa TaxID=1194695 RepID=A0A5A7T5E8_CUCMM|nr:putative nuclease HARBI1 [Cucumis melo var. makuwa]TYJ95894.1 putative nuclease HARBI1 [Cucumis melo var. makuwa]
MDRRHFAILCHLLRIIAGLTLTEVVDVEEMVAMFLHILTHDVKNRVIQRKFMRSGETISRHFNMNCLCALDGTYIKVNVPTSDRARYRTRKGRSPQMSLACVTRKEISFTYLPVGRDQLQTHASFVMPFQDLMTCSYYHLVDVRYPNVEGFLASYRGQRYHLQQWCGAENAPLTSKEFFNMKHSSAHNVIERAFNILKGWEMTNFDITDDIYEVDFTHVTIADDDIHYTENFNEWSQWRDELSEEMFSDWELRNQ